MSKCMMMTLCVSEKFNVRQQTRSALLKLVENRPESPLLFLADYFDSISAESKTDKVSIHPIISCRPVANMMRLTQKVIKGN